jgi:hypothetical protein
MGESGVRHAVYSVQYAVCSVQCAVCTMAGVCTRMYIFISVDSYPVKQLK